MSEQQDQQLQKDDQQQVESVPRTNEYMLVCPHCNCKILRPGMGVLVEDKEAVLPIGVSNPDGDGVYRRWWVIDNQFKFENIGFTRDVKREGGGGGGGGPITKYLVCADCEKEAVGFHIVQQEKPPKFYLCCDLVKEQM